MTTPTPPNTVAKLGPGTLQIGSIGSPIDCSCLVNGCRITSSKDQGDSTTKLCGTVRPGNTDYTFELSGNMDVDVADSSGILALSYSAKGTEQPFTFTPNTAAGTTASGTLVIDPLDFGADNYGDDMTSDFAFSIVGDPDLTWSDDGGGGNPSTTATAGAPGTFDGDTPADLTALDSITADPSTAWDTGDYVELGDGSDAYWDGTAWQAGEAP